MRGESITFDVFVASHNRDADTRWLLESMVEVLCC